MRARWASITARLVISPRRIAVRQFERPQLPQFASSAHHVARCGTVTPARAGWLGARPRTLPAAVVPVAVGAAARSDDGGIVWWRVGARSSCRCCCRSASTTPTTTATACAAPTMLASGRCGWSPSGPPRPLRSSGRRCCVRVVGRAGPGAGRVDDVVAARRRAWPHPRRLGLHRWAQAVRLSRSRRSVRVHVLRARGDGRHDVRGDRGGASARVGRRRAGSGCLACALLVVNNLRDIPTDTVSGKRTLAVRIGDPLAPDGCTWRWSSCALILAVVLRSSIERSLLAWSPCRCRCAGPSVVAWRIRAALIGVLGATGRVQLAYGALLTLGLALGADRQSSQSDAPQVGQVARDGRRGRRRGSRRTSRRDRRCHPLADRGELGVVLAGQHEHRHRRASPSRSTAVAEHLCRPDGGWMPCRPPCCARRCGDRRRSRSRPANRGCASHRRRTLDTDLDDPVGRGLVGGARAARSSSSSMPACRADEDQPLDAVRRREGEVRHSRPPSSTRRTCPAGLTTSIEAPCSTVGRSSALSRRGPAGRRVTTSPSGRRAGDRAHVGASDLAVCVKPWTRTSRSALRHHRRRRRTLGAGSHRAILLAREPAQHGDEGVGVLCARDRPLSVDHVGRHGRDAGSGARSSVAATSRHAGSRLEERDDLVAVESDLGRASASTSGSPMSRPSMK